MHNFVEVLSSCDKYLYAIVLSSCDKYLYATVLSSCDKYLYATVLSSCDKYLYATVLSSCDNVVNVFSSGSQHDLLKESELDDHNFRAIEMNYITLMQYSDNHHDDDPPSIPP